MGTQNTPTILINPIRDEIINFDNLRESATGKLNLENWLVLSSQQNFHIFSVNKKLNGNLAIRNTICIGVDLVVKVFGEDDDDTLFSLQLCSWPQLQTLIDQCGVHVKREADVEFLDVVDKTVNSQTNSCDVKQQQKDTLAVEFCDANTKAELPDVHQSLTEIIENAISESVALHHNNSLVSQSSYFHESTLPYSQFDDQNSELLEHNTCEISTRQSPICPICNESYAVDEMDRHMRQHFIGDSYQCYVCGREYRNLIGLKNHAKTNHTTGSDEFFCGICKNAKVYETKAGIEEHMKNRHCKALIKEQEMKCSTCGKVFTTLKKYTEHVKRHDKSKWKKCPICKKSFGSLTRHINGNHFKIRNYVCDICGSAYTQWTSLKGHMESKHMQNGRKETPSVFPCETCGKTFPFRRSLLTHAKLHSGKLYVCDECGQSFRHPKYLKKHHRQHREIVKLKCTMCEKEYVQKVGLRLHMQKVHGIVSTTQRL